MNGPAYPIINRLRIPRGPHRLRDRRWPPVEPPAPDSEPEVTQSERLNADPQAIPQDTGSTSATTHLLELKNENSTDSAPVVIAGSEETLNPAADPSIWEETKPSLTHSENQTYEKQSSGEKEPEISNTEETEPKHNKSTF